MQDLQPRQAQQPDATAGLQVASGAAEVASSEVGEILEPKKKGFLGILNENELLETPRERGTNPRVKGTNPRAKDRNPRALRDPYSKRVIREELVPDDLEDCGALLIEFWSCKKGTRSQRVWNRVCDKLRQWSADQRKEALERAIAAGWGDVFEPQPQRASGAYQAPEQHKHPASRLFQGGRFVDEGGPTTNPVLQGLMG